MSSSRGLATARIAGRGLPERWNATPEEAAATFPCDALAQGGFIALTRAIDVDAPPPTVFRWLCQLRAAPYSYDWIDNLGRRSPRQLSPGLDDLRAGQRFLIGTITSVVHNQHITARATPDAERLFGVISLTYQVISRRPDASRMLVRLDVHPPNRLWERARYLALAWGDVIMMRKQLRTLKKLAESPSATDHIAQ
jgi:hypothetical protein